MDDGGARGPEGPARGDARHVRPVIVVRVVVAIPGTRDSIPNTGCAVVCVSPLRVVGVDTSVEQVNVRLSAFVMPNVLAIFLAAAGDALEAPIWMDTQCTIGGNRVSHKEDVYPEKGRV